MANSDCANNAEIGQFDLILDQTIHGTVVAPQVMSVEKKVLKCIAVTSICNEAATDAIWTWSHLGCKSHVEHVLDTENSKFSWQGTVFNFTLEVRGDLCWQLHLIHWWEEVGKMSKATPTSPSSTSSTITTSTTSCSSAVTTTSATLSSTLWS